MFMFDITLLTLVTVIVHELFRVSYVCLMFVFDKYIVVTFAMRFCSSTKRPLMLMVIKFTTASYRTKPLGISPARACMTASIKSIFQSNEMPLADRWSIFVIVSSP